MIELAKLDTDVIVDAGNRLQKAMGYIEQYGFDIEAYPSPRTKGSEGKGASQCYMGTITVVADEERPNWDTEEVQTKASDLALQVLDGTALKIVPDLRPQAYNKYTGALVEALGFKEATGDREQDAARALEVYKQASTTLYDELERRGVKLEFASK